MREQPQRRRLRERWAPVLLWVAAGCVASLQAWGGLRRPFVDRLSDLQVYLGSVRQLHDGGSLYDFAAAATGAPFTYPPFAGLVFSPLVLVPFQVVAVAWSAATIAVVALLAVAVVRRSELRGGPADRWLPAGLALALFASAPLSSNLRFGQISVFLIALILVDALRLVPDRFVGVATGVAAAVKLTPLIFVPYLWFSGQRRAAVTATGTFLGCSAAAWLVLPGDSVRFWFTELLNVNRVGNIHTGGNQSLNGALLRWDVPDRARSVLVALVGGAVVVMALVRAVRAVRNDRPLAAAVIVGAAGLVFSPVSWTHHQVWLVLAAVVAVGVGRRAVVGWAAFVLAVMVLPVTSVGATLPGGEITGNARLWLAIAVAAAVPFVAVRRESGPRVASGGPARSDVDLATRDGAD
ncbi:MAG TPA: glycosyltransferase 87 family protein [Catenuloplanes sp.]|jgi:alpha-1,2-mannosyltransferase